MDKVIVAHKLYKTIFYNIINTVAAIYTFLVQVIEDNWHGYKFTDILNLNKINGEWKIVAKIYDTLSGK